MFVVNSARLSGAHLLRGERGGAAIARISMLHNKPLHPILGSGASRLPSAG